MKKEEKTPEEAIEQAKEIAKTGTVEEKENFVEWCCDALDYLSYQLPIGNKETIEAYNVVKAQYYAYLKELTQKQGE